MRDFPDSNAKDLYAALELRGWKVCRIRAALQKKRGVPDAIVSRRGSRLNHFVEVKAPGGKLRPEQIEFACEWPSGCFHFVRSSFEANLLMTECEEQNRFQATRPSSTTTN